MDDNKKAELKQATYGKVVEQLQRLLPEEWRVEGQADTLDYVTLFHPRKQDGGVKVKLAPLFAKIEQQESEQQQWIDSFVEKIILTAKEAIQKHHLRGNEARIYPVLRPTSFITMGKNKSMVWREHTAETTVMYALDLEASYILITKEMLEDAGITEGELHDKALANLARLESVPKQDKVGENIFYFFAADDSYSASRVLNPDLLSWMSQKVTGKMGVALPHQDVLIIADIADAKGAYMLAQIAVDFSMRGNVPISSIPFMYVDGELEPYMVMRNPKPRHTYPSHGGRKKRPPEQ
jgi:uncharacterized protein YtpQ (UPF0354 family)